MAPSSSIKLSIAEQTQLLHIAVATAQNHQRLTGDSPRVAFLSFSTRGSAEHAKVDKMRRAASLFCDAPPTIPSDGELHSETANPDDDPDLRALLTVATRCNNDHVLSFDGTTLGISHHTPETGGKSVIYTLPVTGGNPRRVTEPSWPDSRTPRPSCRTWRSAVFQGLMPRVSIHVEDPEALTPPPRARAN